MTLLDRLLDDAATFPPGDLPLAEAVPAHLAHRRAPHAALLGPLVVGGDALRELTRIARRLRPGSLDVALAAPVAELREALRTAAGIPAVRVVAVEAALPAGMSAAEAIALVEPSAARVPQVFVELPRDERREQLVGRLAAAGYFAKVRTGGPTADAHPDEEELGATVAAVVEAGVPFKATAGLHHAVSRTDPGSGFEQHGFLNLLLATAAARAGASEAEVARLLAERDPARVLGGVQRLDASVRESFRSLGTCSIAEPVAELGALGLLSGTSGTVTAPA